MLLPVWLVQEIPIESVCACRLCELRVYRGKILRLTASSDRVGAFDVTALLSSARLSILSRSLSVDLTANAR